MRSSFEGISVNHYPNKESVGEEVPWKLIRSYIKAGDRVVEFYHGERSDILSGLAEIVGERGRVIGVDALNPGLINKKRLSTSVDLVGARIPSLPLKDQSLDAIIIREFVWSFFGGGKLLQNRKEVASAIRASLKDGGYLLLTDHGAFGEEEVSVYCGIISELYGSEMVRVYPKDSIQRAEILVFQRKRENFIGRRLEKNH